MLNVKDESVNISLREATTADEPFMLEVYASTRGEELEGLGWDENLKRAFMKTQYIARERSYPRADNRIIVLNGKAIGRILVDRTDSAICLTDIALLTTYQNCGIGSHLIRNLINEAVSCGKPLKLHVLETSAAVRLYERLGFRRTGFEAAYLEMTWTP